MALLPRAFTRSVTISVNYTNRDFESMRRALLERIPQVTERWTDHNPSDLGVVLLELFAAAGDMLAYYMDNQVSEAFLETARQRQSVINLCKLISYRLDSAVAASTELTFMLDTPKDFDVTIPRGTRCQAIIDRETIPFETVEPVTIYQGNQETTVSARQGWRELQRFVGTGLPWQNLRLSAQDIAQGSIQVEIDGDPWREVLHFRESGREDRHFRTETDALDTTQIMFGDGIRGVAPVSGTAIHVSYLRTLGKNGNLGRHLINQLQDPIQVNNARIAVSVTNRRPATGGADREPLEHAREQAPAEIQTVWKAVTKPDFLALATGFPGVAKAQLLDVNDCTNDRFLHVSLVIAPNSGGPPSPLLLNDLQAFLETRKMVTAEITLYEPHYREVGVNTEVVALPGEDPDTLKDRVSNALSEFFRFERVSFGQKINASDINALIDNLRGVDYVETLELSNASDLRNGQLPVLGNLDISVRTA